MADSPSYLVLGRGRWASVIEQILVAEHRAAVSMAGSRIEAGETSTQYQDRLSRAFAATKASVLWICLPFGAWTSTIVAAALAADLDVIAECPWLAPRETTAWLLDAVQKKRRIVAIHYEYCMLDGIDRWRKQFASGDGLIYHGTFSIDRPGRHGAVAELQLGSHLLALREYAVPKAAIGQIKCAFNSPNQRMIRLEKDGELLSSIDFLANQEPIIQRFIESFEQGRNEGSFPLDLDFATQVASEVGHLHTAYQP